MDIALSEPQYDFLMSESKETFYIGGVGSGKTFCLAARALMVLAEKDVVCGVYSPTKQVLKKSTLRSMSENWAKMGFLNGVHYVVDRRPPAKWGVKPFSIKDNAGILTTIYGSYAILDGLDNFNSQRGTQLDEIFIDEFRDIKEDARKTLLGRLRGEKYKESGKMNRIWYATTPPDNPYLLQKLAESQTSEQKFVFGTSFDNQENLPDGYIETLASLLDSETYEREVLGRFVFSNGKRFAYDFNKEKHVKRTELNKNLRLHLSFDFNIDPATCIIGQHTDNRIIIHDEIKLKNVSIYDVCNEIKRRYPNYIYIVTGDASGGNREKADKDLQSMYDIIQKELGVSSRSIQTFNSNPGHLSNKALLNSILLHFDISINPNCTYLIQDLDMVRCDDQGKIDKSNKEIGHLLDCLRYYLHAWFAWFVKI